MRTFCVRSLVFVVPLIALGAFLEGALRRIPNDYAYKRAYLDRHAKDIEVLILGSSHSYYGIDPCCLGTRAFNASHVSQSIKYDDFILEKYWDCLERLRVVVWPISYFTLFWELEQGLESWRVKDYVIYYDCPYHGHGLRSRFEILNGKMTSHVRRLLRYYWRHQDDIMCDESGGILRPSQSVQQDLVATGSEAVSRHKPSDYSNVERILNRLEARLRKCRDRGIEVVFVTMPAWTTYRNGMSQDDVALITSSLNALCGRYDNASYVNYLADARFGEGDFRNADHLNAQGAQKFSRLLKGVIDAKAQQPDLCGQLYTRRANAVGGSRN